MEKGKGPIRKRSFDGKRQGAGGPGKPVDKEKEALRLDKMLHDHNAKTGGNTEIYEKKKETYIAEKQKQKQDNLDDELKKFMEAQPVAAKVEKKPSEKKEEEAPKAAEEPATQSLEVTKKKSSAAKREVTQAK